MEGDSAEREGWGFFRLTFHENGLTGEPATSRFADNVTARIATII
jgi:hypothetical protein